MGWNVSTRKKLLYNIIYTGKNNVTFLYGVSQIQVGLEVYIFKVSEKQHNSEANRSLQDQTCSH